MLPEPVIPFELHVRFCDPLRTFQAQAVDHNDQQHVSGPATFDQDATIAAYQHLLTELPPINRQLLLYLLDLFAVCASKSDRNKMTTPRLASIFQPGILAHTDHTSIFDRQLSQVFLIFVIENQDSFLIGMPGTTNED